jgi:DNA-binding transcriptional LysR family regulator
MKLYFLRYFCVLAEELHFRKAAARLAITQPPLSAAIKALEQELGAQLLVRNSKLVQLTPAGSAFLLEARQVLERLERAGTVVKAVEAGMRGRLDIGTGGSLIYREVPAIVERFRSEAPQVELVLYELSTAEQLERVARGRLHAGFVNGAMVPPHLDALPLREDIYVLCVPERHPVARRRTVHLKDVADEPFLMFSREVAPANHDNVIALFSAAGVHPRTIHQARSWLTIVAMVSQGSGVALVPKSLARAGMAGVCFVALAGPQSTAPALLVWNPNGREPHLTHFVECAGRVLKRGSRSAAR